MSSDPGTFIPYGRQTIGDGDIAAVVEVLRSRYLTQGPTVPTFDQATAARVGALYRAAATSAIRDISLLLFQVIRVLWPACDFNTETICTMP